MTIYPHNYAEAWAALSCSFCLIKHPTVANKWLMTILWLTIVVEFLAKATEAIPTKYLMYNVFTLVEWLCYMAFLWQLFRVGWVKKGVACVVVLIGLFAVFNMLFWQGAFVYNSYSRMVFSMVTSGICILVYWNFANEVTGNDVYPTKPYLLVTTSLLLFYGGNFINYNFFSWMMANKPTEAVFVYKLVNHSLNVVMYAGFSIAFFWEYIYLRNKGLKVIS